MGQIINAGDVYGPDSATDNALARFDTTGKLLQNSGSTVDDSGNLSANTLSVTDAATTRTNLGLVAGGAGDIWVEKAGDTMTGGLTISNPSDTGNLQFDWNTNNVRMFSTASRHLHIGDGGGYLDFDPAAASGAYKFTYNRITNTTGSLFRVTAVGLTGSSGTQNGVGIDPAINQSSTAGYTALLINPTETATGSGSKNLIDAQVGGSSKWRLTNIGSMIFSSGLSISGTNGSLTLPASAILNFVGDTNLYRSAANTLKTDDALTVSGGLTTTIANASNAAGITVNQNDTTNNPRGISITNAGTAASLFIDANGTTSSSTSVGGAILLDNTGNTGAGLIIYSNAGASSGRLVNIRADNAAFDQAALHIDYDGTANALEVVNNSTDSSSQAFNVVSNNPNDSSFTVAGVETGKGTAKIVHTGTGTDANASAISVDLQGTGTAAQGIYVDSTATGGTTGNLLRLRNESADKFVVDSTGKITSALSQSYTESNVTTDRTFDANATSIDELADVLGTLIADLRALGVIN